ncbi:MAG: hypothetical protein RLZZ568_1519 [Cyanobacteriota bacterium]
MPLGLMPVALWLFNLRSILVEVVFHALGLGGAHPALRLTSIFALPRPRTWVISPQGGSGDRHGGRQLPSSPGKIPI